MIEKPNVYSNRVQKAIRINESESARLREKLNILEAQRRLQVLRTENRQRILRWTLHSVRQSTGTMFPDEPDPRNHTGTSLFLYGAPVDRRKRTYQRENSRQSLLSGHQASCPCRKMSQDTSSRGSCSCRCQPLRLPDLPRTQPGFSLYFSEMSIASSSPTPSEN